MPGRATNRLLVFLTTLLICLATTSYADEPPDGHSPSERQELPLVVAGMQQALDVPLGNNLFTGPLHPGFVVGSEVEYLHGRYGRLFQTANIGYFHHRHLDRVVFLNTEIAYGYDLDFGLGFEVLHGVGYGHLFTDRQLYSLETGEAATDWGQPSVLVSLALGINYDLRTREIAPLTLFVRYQSLLQFRFASQAPLPVMPRTIFSVGTKIHFHSGSNR